MFVTESMPVLTDPATYGILNSELTNCPRTAAVLAELAARWQQMMGTLQRVEHQAVSSQNVANAVESLSKARSDVQSSKVIDEAQKMFVVRELMPKDNKRQFF